MNRMMIATAAGLMLAGCAVKGPEKTAEEPFPIWSAPRAITKGPHEHFLASYFAIDSWSPDKRYVLALETDLNGRLPEQNEKCTLGIVDLEDENKFIPVTTTACWNFQEAAMAFWMDNDTILFNDVREGKFRAIVMNWKTKAERVLPMPVSAVSEDRTWAVSINYARLFLTRPDYGYAGPGQDSQKTVEWPENDGLWTMNLKTGETKLILSIAAGRKQMPPTKRVANKPGNPLAYYCHTVISKGGSRIFFLARSVDWYDEKTHTASRPWQTTSFTVDADGKNLRRCFPDTWGGSHFNWLNDDTMVVTVYPESKENGKVVAHHALFTVGQEDKVHLMAPALLNWDGHCVFSPDGKWMSTEGYWDNDCNRHWALLRMSDEAVIDEGSFFVPKAYRGGGGYYRCDLHARYRKDGKQIAFNSVHEGSRQIYVRDITNR